MWKHWEAVQHPAKILPPMEPGCQATFEVYSKCWPQLNEIGTAVVSEVQEMILEWEEITEEWFNSIHPDLQTVYTTNNRKPVAQVPVLIELMRLADFPGADELERELSERASG